MMWTNQGWFHHYHVEDYSGGLVVHMLSGLTACCAQYFIGKGEIKQIHPVLDADALDAGDIVTDVFVFML